jgi:hypothetical protein
VKIYLEENYERINVPVPQFGGGDPADIIHDFQRVGPTCGGASGRVSWSLRARRILEGVCKLCSTSLWLHLPAF